MELHSRDSNRVCLCLKPRNADMICLIPLFIKMKYNKAAVTITTTSESWLNSLSFLFFFSHPSFLWGGWPEATCESKIQMPSLKPSESEGGREGGDGERVSSLLYFNPPTLPPSLSSSQSLSISSKIPSQRESEIGRERDRGSERV